MNVTNLNTNQAVLFCQKLQITPSLYILWIGSILIYILSLWAVLDMSRVNITKLIISGILFSTLSFSLLYFLINSPLFISNLFK